MASRSRRSRGSGAPPSVVQRHHAGLQGLRRDELEVPRALQALKQRRPVAGDDGMDDDAVLVDQPQLLERGGELGAAHEHAARGLLLQLLSPPREGHPPRGTVFFHGKSLREADTTYFGLASSLRAHSRIARGAFSSRATAGQALSISS